VKVCLIDPILFSFQRVRGKSLKNNASMSFFPPLGLCYIANFLRKNGVDVSIADRKVLMVKNRCGFFAVNALTEGELRRFRPDIVGITVTTPTLFDVRNNILKIVRQVAGGAMIVLGGPHASALPEDTLHDNPEVDVVCRGEGELVMLEIAQQKRLNDILGISYREGKRIVTNPTRKPHRTIDDFCFPARDLLDMEFYCRPNPYVMHGLYMRSTTVFTSRGCPYNCTFCAGRTASGGLVRFQTPELVVDEIERLVKDYGIEGVYFADDMFDANKERAAEICRKLISRGLHKKLCWNAQMRANSVDENLLQLMKQAGCIRVDVGFESGSQKILDIIDKRTTVAQNYDAARALRRMGLQVHANIVVGIPGEDMEDLKKTRAFMKRAKATWIGFGEFVPLPGSKLFDELLANGRVTKEQVERLESFNFTKLSHDTFDRFIKDIRLKIVLPTRIKSYLSCNIRRPAAYIHLLKLLAEYIGERYKINQESL